MIPDGFVFEPLNLLQKSIVYDVVVLISQSFATYAEILLMLLNCKL